MAMKVGIVVSGSQQPRYADFEDSLIHLRGHNENNVTRVRGGSVAENRNIGQKWALKHNCDAVLYLDDDQVFPPDSLQKLIARAEAGCDVVSGLYLKREPPWIPHVYHDSGVREPLEGLYQWQVHYLQPEEEGLVKCDMVAAGFFLVKMHVFEKLEKPYWTLGQGMHKDKWADDEQFCTKVKAAGFDIWCDLDCRIGHCVQGVIWPDRDPQTQKWISVFAVGREPAAIWPAAAAAPEAACGMRMEG